MTRSMHFATKNGEILAKEKIADRLLDKIKAFHKL